MISTSSCRPGLCKYFILLLLLLFRTLALPNLYQLVSPWSLQIFHLFFIFIYLLFRTLALPNLYQLVSPWSLQSFFFFRTLPLQHCYQ
jgi:hypothetical protein